MRALFASAGIALTATVAAVVFLWPVQRSGPEAIDYGRDACAHCRMRISQEGFGGELRDSRGALTKYDDIGCLLRAMVGMHREVPEAWVEDHAGDGFTPLLAATLVRIDAMETPMGSHVVAFADGAAAAAFAEKRGGQVVALEDLLRSPNAKEMQK